MRFAIVDDMEVTLKILNNLILKYTAKHKAEVDCFSSAQSFLKEYALHKYDALFLDIDMPEITGFKLTDILHENHDNIPIVYVTARDDLITNAFRYKHVGFVRKQYLESEMKFAIETVISEISAMKSYISFTERKSLGGKKYTTKINDILYIKTDRHYLEIFLINGSVISVRDKISNYSDNPDFKDFVMIDTGILANLANIKIIEDNAHFPDGQILGISRRRVQSVLQAYIQYSKKVLI